jgi:hypothetical protein
MKNTYYVHTTKINARIADTVLDGQHIIVDGYTYEKVSKRPVGKLITRRFSGINSDEKLILF